MAESATDANVPWAASLVHGGFRFKVPKGWTDHSVVSFVSPVQQYQGTGLAGKRGSDYVSNLRVEFVDAGKAPQTADAYLDQTLGALKARGRPLTEVRRFDIKLSNHAGRCVECVFQLDEQVIRQLQSATRVGGVWMVAIGSCPEIAHKESVPILTRMIESIELAPRQFEMRVP
jgi:hypothetical protein